MLHIYRLEIHTNSLLLILQTILLTYLIDRYGGKTTIIAGLLLQAAQLLLLGFCQRSFMMWISGIIASISSITYPAISAYISTYADADKQGLVQGLITGVRSLCGGIGPAMFGLLFNIFDVDMYEEIKANPFSPHTAQDPMKPFIASDVQPSPETLDAHHHHVPSPLSPIHTLNKHPHAASGLLSGWVVGPPFLFGAVLVLLAAVAATFIPDTIMPYRRNPTKTTSPTNYYRYTTVDNGTLTVCNNGSRMNSSNCELLEDLDD